MPSSNVFDIGAYCQRMERYLGDQDGVARLFWRALSFGVDAHQYQMRKSGEAYVSHPCLVALILVEELGVTDPATLAAAMLHDTIEDVEDVTSEVISSIFGKHVAAIVDGCTKISNFDGDRQSFSKMVHRKIFAQASSRVEILLVKLADRLHNLRTMDAMPRHKRQKIADETLAVYAPMSGIMGLYALKRELYDLALIYKFPRQGQKVMGVIRKLEKLEQAQVICDDLKESLIQAGVEAEVRLKAKGLWAYYDPLSRILSRQLENPLEVLVVVDGVHSCYQALGVINQLFPPIPRTIRDFIANPKATGYQSLHSRANIRGRNYLFKIRTSEMMADARNGIVREWLTQRTVPGGFPREIREMLGILGRDDSYRDIIAASGKKEIYTYTPKGDCFSLPRNSTVLDFAFKVHTEVGRRCLGAKVGQQQVGVDHVLADGDRVRIITREEPVRFEPEIHQLCQTARARSELSRNFRFRRQQLARRIGRSLLEQELKRYGMPLELLEKDEFDHILEYYGAEDLPALYLAIGQGRQRLKELLYEIKNGLYADRQTLLPPTGALNRVYLETLDQACIKLSRCCRPAPTEKGLLALMDDRGLSVHRKECSRLKGLKMQREDVLEVRWHLKNTRVRKRQNLLVLDTPRNRLFMMLSVAPLAMKIVDVDGLSRQASAGAWDIAFEVQTLQELKYVLQHFQKGKLDYEFALEQ